MPLSDAALSGDLKTLYADMDAEPMSPETFADRMAQVIDTQTKTAQVNPGISVNIPATSPPGTPSAGATNAPGSLS